MKHKSGVCYTEIQAVRLEALHATVTTIKCYYAKSGCVQLIVYMYGQHNVYIIILDSSTNYTQTSTCLLTKCILKTILILSLRSKNRDKDFQGLASKVLLQGQIQTVPKICDHMWYPSTDWWLLTQT